LKIKVFEVDEISQERVEKIINVDTAISAEHARVEFDEKSGLSKNASNYHKIAFNCYCSLYF